MGIIFNAGMRPLFDRAGSVPDVSGALQEYFQPLVFTPVTEGVVGFQVQELGNPINFRGVIQPFTERQLELKPEGQRAWSWYTCHADPSLTLDVDDVVVWNGQQTRVMGRKNFRLYGYVEYHLVQDWTGSGPA